MKPGKRFCPYKYLALLLTCMLCVAVGCGAEPAAGNLDGLQDALSAAASLDEQLALL